MSYRVQFTTAAARQVRKLPRSARERVLDAVAELADDPRPHGAKKLVGEQTAWRIRTGDYRVIYDVFDAELVVTVVRAAHRGKLTTADVARREVGTAPQTRRTATCVRERRTSNSIVGGQSIRPQAVGCRPEHTPFRTQPEACDL